MFSLFKSTAPGVRIVSDIGGTKMRIATLRDEREFGTPHIVPTPSSYEEGIQTLVAFAKESANNAPIEAICISVPGVVESGVIYKLPHLPAWDGRNIAADIRARIAAPVYVENDAALVGLGEATAGAGVGSKIMVYVTVSTGYGGVRIVEGNIDVHAGGFEPGKCIVDITRLNEKDHGIIEHLVSGSAIKERFNKEPIDALADASLQKEMAEYLAIGLYNSALHWSPQAIVLGGSLIVGHNPIPLEMVSAKFNELMLNLFPSAPEIKKAALGDLGGLHGAAALLRLKLPK